MSGYRTAKGKVIDMDTLSTMNERTRAVGNMGVNARGDVIDQHNRIVKEGSKRINTAYHKTVTPAQAPSNREPLQPDVKIDLTELTAEEREFEEDYEDDEDSTK
jgi:hypothetical protein